ncbi:Plasma membrane low glucose sensor [Exophiala xenobiotica]|nr:Plasma membrane low glucose sensor [Exophiala xenobiotica]KAK5215038.1 Plasma membrane low glucose sensor [Exophiala xenobiotica]KAK5221477.1 Plasma membrane low glucose sensor [Exophiala xenobiotica]KAK5245764.1 Plasma membrane low glucose sensor [Exophiala xenobiotica]KAK5261377.1 Plasma membrane low glucose sensor [Exophiala xenobiotica]
MPEEADTEKNIGLILAAVANNSTAYRADNSAYRIPVGVQIIFGVALAVGMLFLPETSRYLIKVGKTGDALASLGFLHRLPIDHAIVNQEYREILDNLELERAKGSASYLTCWRPPFLKRQITGCLLQALQQLSGINFIIYYGTRFFLTSGIKDPFLITMITNIVAFVSTIPGLYLVEIMGRRNLLLAGAIGMTVCQVIVRAVGVSTDSCAWIVTGDIFPLHIRAKALSMTTSSNWLFNFILAFVTPYMADTGPGNAGLGVKVFFVWTAFCLMAVVFVWALIYETKGLSLEQVDEL